MSAEMAQFAINAVMGVSKGYLEGEMIAAENRVNEANTIASNLIRASGNKLSAAKGSLARFNQTVNNSRVMQSSGEQASVALGNYRRARDNADKGDFESQVQFAEQAGSQAAASAASGLTGGVVDMVNSTSALRNARIKDNVQQSKEFGSFDVAAQQGRILRAGIEGMDNSSIMDGIDYTIDVHSNKKRAGNLWTDINGGQNAKQTANWLGSAFSTKSEESKFTFNAAKDSQAANIN